MPNAELLPPPVEHDAAAENIGDVALQAYVDQGLAEIDDFTRQAAEQGAEQEETNHTPEAGEQPQDEPGYVRPEDAGRVHDIEAAHEAALKENRAFDIEKAHAEALLENEKFDTEAALREKERQDRLEAEKTPVEETNALPRDVRQEAIEALKEAGEQSSLPLGSKVSKDTAGNIVITSQNNVKLVTPKAGGGKQVTNYHYDKATKKLTVKKQGAKPIVADVGDTSPNELLQESKHTIRLVVPPAVASMVGTKKITTPAVS